MCYERWMERRQRQAAEEDRDLWRDFERTRPLVDPEPPAEEPDRVELREEPVPAHER